VSSLLRLADVGMIGIGAILVSVVRPDFMADDVSHDDRQTDSRGGHGHESG
jgi:hypothetical protein